jgi:hypothetical protein
MEATLYNDEFITNLQFRISKALAEFGNKDLANQRFNLGLTIYYENYKYLGDYWKVLEEIKSCNCCYNNIKIPELVSQIQNTINQL